MNELVRRDPFNALAPFDDGLFALPSLFRPFASRVASGPRMDVMETDSAYRLSIEMPGVPKEAIQVSVYDSTVTISAEVPAQAEDNETQWLLRERSSGKFSRSIALPEAVDDEASEARCTDGVLTLTLKKKNATQAKRLAIH